MSKNNDKTQRINLAVLGNSAVGKTSFILRYAEERFDNNYTPTLGIDFLIKETISPNGEKLKIYLYDTAGQEKFKSISLNTIKLADGIVLIYDISNQKSFESIAEWTISIKNLPEEDYPILLIGNKCDLIEERIVEKNEGEEEARKNGFLFYETSNKDGTNIEESINFLISKILEKRKTKNENENKNKNESTNKFQLDKNKTGKRKKFCNC